MFINKTVGLWLARKAVYTLAGGVLGGGAAYIAAHADPTFNLSTLTLPTLVSALGSAVIGDVRRKMLPDFLQMVTGQDPREDG